jgi:nuclear mRNA export protein PCID2/THP1
LLSVLQLLGKKPGAPFDEVGSKKAGVLDIVNQLFAMYFRLNILRLCKNLIRPVETRKLNEQGDMGAMVTYRYYIGRLNMFEDQHELAEQNLDYAFQHCHRNAIHNKRCILRYLVPVKLFRGRLPTNRCKYHHH